MIYPQELIEEIRNQNDIVSVISEYITLKPKGRDYFGLCPFHNESTPSFSVSSDKQFYYCFGCGESGNVYSFIMRMENCDFVDAVKRLSERVNIKLPEPELSAEKAREESLKKRIYEMNKLAGKYFYLALNSASGKNALNYLNNRSVKPEIQKKFGIGYAPSGRASLCEYLKDKGYRDEEILKSGLVVESKDGKGYFDRFFNRLMFPIFDLQNRVVGFGGRIIDKGEPKYLNSPETIVFNKSRTLYGMNFAKAARKKEIILVEGYMDAISVFQAGFENVVAGLGTAFNNDHAKTLRRLSDSVILLYDSDEAGEKAALRAIPVLVRNGFEVKVTQVTGAKDADEFIKKYGVEEFGKIIVNAVSYITFRINSIKKNYNMSNTDHKVHFAEESAKILAEVDNEIQRDVYAKEIALNFEIDESALKRRISKIKDSNESDFLKTAEMKRKRIYSGKDAKNTLSKDVVEAQRVVLSLCAEDSKILNSVFRVLKVDEFENDTYRSLAEKILMSAVNGHEIVPADVISEFETLEEQNTVSSVFALKPSYDDVLATEKAVMESVKLMKSNYMDMLLAKAEDVAEIKKLVEEKRNLDDLNISIRDGQNSQ